MATQPIKLNDIQFSGAEEAKARRLYEELKRLESKLNELIRQVGGDPILGNSTNARIMGASTHTAAPAGELLPGQWELTLVDTGAQVFRVRYNDGGTIRTGDLTLS